jgi:chemotaxis protein histidine kinase CheA/CheY-like chemotaxis protein
MKPGFADAVTSLSLADRLAELVRFWQDFSKSNELPTPPAEFDSFRVGLHDVALEAEVEDRGQLARALRRIRLLSEVWEWLECEPEQADPAAEVADFCLKSIEQVICDLRSCDGSDAREISDEILGRSDERFSNYLSLVDSSSAGQSVLAEPVLIDETCTAQDDAPPALDHATLLRLLQGSTGHGNQPAPRETSVEGPQYHELRVGRRAEAEQPIGDVGQPKAPIHDPPPEERSFADGIAASQEFSLKMPSLPARFDLDDEMREAFLADACDLFERIERIVIGLGSPSDHPDSIRELRGCFHTLKGAAGCVGLNELASLVHDLEERLGHASVVPPALKELLYQAVSYLERIIGWLRRLPASHVETTAQGGSGAGALFAPGEPPQDDSAGPAPSGAESVLTMHAPRDEGPIRVPAARFDELTDLASDLIEQGRFWLSQAENMKTLASTVHDSRNRLLESLDRLHGVGLWEKARTPAALINPETDIPEQLRRLEEQANDLTVLAASAHAAASRMADRGDTLVRLSLQVWESFQSLRIVPIRGLFQRLARVLHDAARVEGRQVAVVMKGEETGVDRALQDKAFEPLLHVVRNAVGHGIESTSDRIRAGKPSTGCVTLEARREANTVVIAVLDDGKGLDDQAIAEKARKLGWLGPHDSPSRKRLHSFLFEPGFSTKPEANAISGRGVGMDVVAREVEQLRGTVDLTSEPMRGTQLTIRLPARLALEPALIVRVAGQPFAVPASQVEHAEPFELPGPSPDGPPDVGTPEPAPSSTTDLSVAYRGQTVPVVFASETLGISHSIVALWPKLVLVRTACRLIGLVVDAIDGAEDLVIKPLSALLAGHPLVSGTSLSINGEVISVLDPSGLERWLHYRTASGDDSAASGTLGSFRVRTEKRMPVLVVDDSISVRRGMARQLVSLGLEVHEVSDGLEALGRLRSCHYGLVLTDLEMPKLDGFALLAEIKRSVSLGAIPVVVATTRNDPETRRRLLELGAEGLLSKPVEPWELARVIEPFVHGVNP